MKTYPRPEGGTFNAVDGVSFEVHRGGEVFGFLGPNGAGKTTTLEIIEGLTDPTSGRAGVLGLDSQRNRTAVKDRIGVQLQAAAYFDFLTLGEILDLFGSFYTRRLDPAGLLDRVGLVDKRSGDERLIELAHRAQDRFEVYLTVTDGLDAREAGDDADLALDRSVKRCIEMGATTEFPEEPE